MGIRNDQPVRVEQLPPVSLHRMGIRNDQPVRVGRFHSDQKHFLNYHRNEVFLKSAS